MTEFKSNARREQTETLLPTQSTHSPIMSNSVSWTCSPDNSRWPSCFPHRPFLAHKYVLRVEQIAQVAGLDTMDDSASVPV